MQLLPATLKALLAAYWFATATVEETTAEAINELFFEVLIAHRFTDACFRNFKKEKEPDSVTIESFI